MRLSFVIPWLAMLVATSTLGQTGTNVSASITYRGAMDGSAGVALDNAFFANATDEDSVIRIYRRDAGGDPVAALDLTAFLEVDADDPETDIEAAARVGDRIYWITSHGRNKNGKYRPSRCRFFATDIKTNASGVTLLPIGKPYKNLLDDLITAPQLKEFNLAAASKLAPKEPGALNIEGLATLAGNQLLIGFRNPIPGGRALLVPLLNPDKTIQGKAARLGAPIRLDLGGLGVRDMALWQGEHLIVAGPIAGGGPFRLFRWAGGDATPALLSHGQLDHLHPEAIIIYPDKGLREIQLLSDDGSDAAKSSATSASQRTFRGTWVKP